MITLKVQSREVPTKTLKTKRKQGKIPAEMYGHKHENQHLFVDEIALSKALAVAGESSLIDLIINDGKPVKVLIHDVQKNPLTDRISHVDFYQVDMKHALTVTVPLIFTGESKAVKELEGTLIKNLNEIEISCLPDDLIHQIEVDISSLKTFDDIIKVGDLKIPKTITIKADLENVVASVVPHYVEKEVVEKPTVLEGVAETKAEELKGENVEKPTVLEGTTTK
jgi:large subunit ribosomal protein L25